MKGIKKEGRKRVFSTAVFNRISRLTLIGVLLLSGNLSYSQEIATESEQTEPVTLNFEKADIEGFIAAVSQITGKSFIVDPRVKGRITVVSGSPLPPESIYQVFLSVLEVHNFSAVESGDFTKIVPTSVIKGTPTRTSFSDPGSRVDEQITQVYRLKHTSATELTPLLRPLLPATSHFAAHPTTNTVVITDTVANVKRILDIVENIDKPSRQIDINIVFLENAKAENLSTVISQLATEIEQEANPGAAQEASRVSIQAEPATNALIIRAPRSEFLMLKSVIDSLDIDTKPTSGIHVLNLKHANAVQITDILSGVASDASQANAANQAAANPLVSIRADEQSNALIIRAGPEEFAELKSVVDRLDVRRAQVYVELIIAEVTQGKEAEIGVEWQVNSSPRLDNQTTITREQTSASTSFTSQTGGVTLGFVNRFIYDLAGNLVPDLSAVLRALRSNNSTNILSTPNLLTLDNEPAEITVGQEVPFITGQYVSNATTGGGNEDGDGGGTPTGLVNPFQTIERKDVGLSLRITPQINDGDVIQLEIEQEVSNVSRTTLQGASDLVTDTRSINTKVLVDDGQIIVLGGLIRDSLVDTYEYVPGLGNIPLLGALFRKKSKTNAKTNLMVFLRPKVIRSQQDMLSMTRGKYNHIKEEEERGQPDTRELLPGVKPPVLSDIDWRTGESLPAARVNPEVRTDRAGKSADFSSGRR